jgi:hypothetical protein
MPKDFVWGPGGKKNRRADLRRHVNFVFQEAAFAASQNPSSMFLGIHL